MTVCVELLNSKVDHKDYMGDSTPWAVKVMQGVNSPRVKLLYDIYHMQIMEGDVIRTIRDSLGTSRIFIQAACPGGTRSTTGSGTQLPDRVHRDRGCGIHWIPGA